MKKLGVLILVLAAYSVGVFTGTYKIFPYEMIRYAKHFGSVPRDSSPSTDAKRFTDTSKRVAQETDKEKRLGVFITYGQSNSANSGQIGYETKNEVFQFFGGQTYLYEDPSLGGTGRNGSVWGMVGDKLIDQGLYEQVVFSMTGWGGKKIIELANGPYYSYFKKEYEGLIAKYGRVDGILFHQGESDNNREKSNENYKKEFQSFLSKIQADGIDSDFFLSLASACENWESDEGLLKAQEWIIRANQRVFRGPNTDQLIEGKFRLPDKCHFSTLGYEKFSDLWVKSIVKRSER